MAGDQEDNSPAVSTPPKQEGASTSNSSQPIFGSNLSGGGFKAFSAGDGSKGFGSSKPAPAAKEAEEEAAEGAEADEEECGAQFTPIVQLQEVATSTGEEAEEAKFESKCKLYRFDDGEWKERGVGVVKLLKHKENERTRLLMRQEKTLKVRANHIVMPGINLRTHEGSDKSRVWSTVDYAGEEARNELFCIRFGSVERAAQFDKAFNVAIDDNIKVLEPDQPSEATAAADEKSKADKKEEADLSKDVQEKASVKD